MSNRFAILCAAAALLTYAVPAVAATEAPQAVHYSQAERDGWLADCHAGFDHYDPSSSRGNGALGALLGAVVGGFAGNGLAGHDDKLEATMAGAGIGGIGGALIGSAIARQAGSHAHDEPYGEAQCADYLARWSAQQGAPVYRPYGKAAYPYPGPVMWVRVPIVRQGAPNPACRQVVKDVIEDPAPAPHARRTIPPRRHSKLVPAGSGRSGRPAPSS